MKRIIRETARVMSQEEISRDVYSLWIKTEVSGYALPGQFVNLYTGDRSRILPRPISICDRDEEKGCLRLVYRVTGPHTGTAAFSRLCPGEKIELLGPLGNGYDVEGMAGKKVLIIGGGIGIPPLLLLAKSLRDSEVSACMGYRDGDLFLKEELEAVSRLYVATEDGSQGLRGNALDAWHFQNILPDILYACGPMPMLKRIKRETQEMGIPCFISLEERMACGIGACLACTCSTKARDDYSHVHRQRVCKEGPVFDAKEVEIR